MRWLLFFLPLLCAFSVVPASYDLGTVVADTPYLVTFESSEHVVVSGCHVNESFEGRSDLLIPIPSFAKNGSTTCFLSFSSDLVTLRVPVSYTVSKEVVHDVVLSGSFLSRDPWVAVENRGNVIEQGCLFVDGICYDVTLLPLQQINLSFPLPAQESVTIQFANTSVSLPVRPLSFWEQIWSFIRTFIYGK